MDVGERYLLRRLVGEGATARVYEAEDTVVGRQVAVKVFRHPAAGSSMPERIDEEARILTRLAHPHLLPVYDSGCGADGHRFLVMPLVRGTTLAALVAEGPVDPREVKRIGKALAGALAHIHALGIVHRDVKPSNVLIAEDGMPYLADFGFAREVDGPALTATGLVVGTAGYLAPEQAEGQGVTPAVDVYALGLVLLEALTGEREYRGTPLERATANALRPPRLPARLGPGWLRVLRSMTARTPAARATAEEVGALLTLGEDLLPGVTPFADTMELSGAAVGSGLPLSVSGAPFLPAAGTAGSASSVQTLVRPARVRRRPVHRRLAAVGAVAFTAVAVMGVAADMLAVGASADTVGPHVTVPSQSVPGAGAAGTTSAPAAASTTTDTPAGSAGPTNSAGSTSSTGPTSSTPPSSSLRKPADRSLPPSAPAPGCKGGDGHGKHKCGPGHENDGK